MSFEIDHCLNCGNSFSAGMIHFCNDKTKIKQPEDEYRSIINKWIVDPKAMVGSQRILIGNDFDLLIERIEAENYRRELALLDELEKSAINVHYEQRVGGFRVIPVDLIQAKREVIKNKEKE